MANKSSLAIELKDLSSYPELKYPPEESQRPEGFSNDPPPITPIVRMSQNSGPVGPNPNAQYPNLPNPPARNTLPQPISNNASNELVRNSMPPIYNHGVIGQNGMLTIPCSGCHGIIQYPPNVPVVFCLRCKATTATRPLIQIVCTFCRNAAFYETIHTHVRCKCGTVYQLSQY